MNFNMIGNMNTHLRTMELKSMWNMRKQNNDYTSKGQERLDQMFERMYGVNGQKEDGTDNRLQKIRDKLTYGGNLSPDELEYLRQKDPKTYAELKNEEMEQKAYEKELRRCKTKEDVERLKMNRINQSLSVISATKNNPNIPKGQKLGIIMKEKRRMDRVNESTAKFVKSGEYAKLPTEAEEALARQEEAERKKAEQTPREEEPAQDETPDADKTERPESPDAPAKAAEDGKPEKTETAEPKPAEPSKAETKAETPEEKKLDRARTRAAMPEMFQTKGAVESPTERKVRRAKAKAAYAAAATHFQPKSASPTLDRNV